MGEKKPEEKAVIRKDILESEHYIHKGEEPWAPATIVISELLNPRNVYVSKFNKRQIRFLSEAVSITYVIREYMNTDITWMEELLRQYARLNKFEDGWTVKQAVNVAKAGSTRMLFNLSRVKRLLYGEEGGD